MPATVGTSIFIEMPATAWALEQTALAIVWSRRLNACCSTARHYPSLKSSFGRTQMLLSLAKLRALSHAI
jgi:hypothetical protein